MAERRNAGILKTALLLAFVLVLFASGCRPALAALPVAVTAEQSATKTPVSTVTAGQPIASATPSVMATTRAVSMEMVAFPTKMPVSTVTQQAVAKETASLVPFATLDNVWPTPPLQLPPPAATIDRPDHVVNILLLGNDVPWAQGGRTDSVIIVSFNRETGKMTILSIPRDLYVVIPGWMMNRINLALPHGHGTDYPGGGGALVKDTILYNLGIPVDYYVRIGFTGFKEMVDGLGGVEIVVNCPIEDWRLRSAELDPEIEDNWQPFMLEPGVRQMDGELALWYVRSRRNSNDIDRGRRQQKIARAILQQARSADLLVKVPALWEGFTEMFETDMNLAEILELAALAPEVDEIVHILLAGEALRPWTVPNSGEAVQLLDREAAAPLLAQLMDPSALQGVSRTAVQVDVVTNDPILYRQVADNLSWYGFDPSFVYRDTPDPPQTTIVYGGPNAKGAFAGRLASIFRHNVDEIIFLDDEEVNGRGYQISLGKGHNPCLPYLQNSWHE